MNGLFPTRVAIIIAFLITLHDEITNLRTAVRACFLLWCIGTTICAILKKAHYMIFTRYDRRETTTK